MALGRRPFLAGLGALGAWAGVSCQRGPAEPSCPPTAAPARAAAASDEREGFVELADFCAGVEPIATAEFEARLASVRERLEREGQGALIVEAGVDMRYLGGPRWGLSERPLLLVVPREADAFLLGPAFEAGTLAARQGPLGFEVRTWDEHQSPYAVAEGGLRDAGVGAGEGVAMPGATRSFVVDGLRAASDARALRADLGIVAAARRIKSPAELALLRRANEATKAALASAAARAQVGMHEREFAAIVREAQEAAGLDSVWVLALFGPNAAYPHGTPEGRELAAGDLILVDTGGFLHGYASDITRTWAFPEPAAIDRERARIWALVHEAQTAALAAAGPGVRCAEVDAAARSVIAAAGFDPDYGVFSHRLGHGIGMQVHEPPYLVRDSDRRLEVGNTMSDEPGVYLPGELGVRLEDIFTITGTGDGVEVFGPRAASLDDPFGVGS